MNTYDRILDQLKQGKILKRRMFEEFASGEHSEELWMSALGGCDFVYTSIEEAISTKSRPKKSKDSITPKLRDINKEVERLVNTGYDRITKWTWRSAEEIREETIDAFQWFATAALLGIENPYLNWLWLCYKSGRIPYGEVKIEGDFSDIVKLSAKAALGKLEEAQAKAGVTRESLIQSSEAELKQRADREEAKRKSKESSEQLVQAKGRAAAALVKQICELKLAGTTVATLLKECKGVDVPASWLELLKAQAGSHDIPWDLVWGPAADWFPSVRQFVSNHCFGVAIATKGASTPYLAYVFLHTSSEVEIFKGSRTIGNDGTDAASAAKLSKAKLPQGFKQFFQEVHATFERANSNGSSEGLYNGSLRGMDDWISEADAFSDLDESPYSLSDISPIFHQITGNYLCVDLKRSTSRKVFGGWYWHEDPEDCRFDRDLKKLVGQWFEEHSSNYRRREA
jgi:hypothetical protein